jgi:hypothetical protein
MKEHFQQHYIELVNDDNMYRNYLQYEKSGGVDDAAQIKTFIVNTESFQDRVSDVIARVLPAFVSPEDARCAAYKKHALQHCMSTFRQTCEFSVSRLTDMLRSYSIRREDASATPPPEIVPDSVLPPPNTCRECVRAYEQEMKRPMYAYELLCVMGMGVFDDPSAGSKVASAVRQLYQTVSDAVTRYEGRHISEHDFAVDWMEDVMRLPASANVAHVLTHRLMRGDTYTDRMKDRIRRKYKSLFGDCASEDDVDFAFARSFACQMDLLDDRLEEMLTDVWKETQCDVENITQVFQDTYGRAPDVTEIDQRVRDYRASDKKDYDKLNERLRVELCGELEYQDVVKQLVQNTYAERSKLRNKDGCMTARVLYATLKRVLHTVPDLQNTARLHDTIIRLVDAILDDA